MTKKVYKEIREVLWDHMEFEDSFDEILNKLNHFIENKLLEGYYNFYFEYGQWYDDKTIRICGIRKETDKERDRRLKKQKSDKDKKRQQKEDRIAKLKAELDKIEK